MHDLFCLDSNNIHGNPGSIIDVGRCTGLGKGQVQLSEGIIFEDLGKIIFAL